MSSGQHFLNRLQDERKVWVDGQVLSGVDLATHPAFKGTIETVASLLDLQDHQEYAERLTFAFEDGAGLGAGGDRANAAFLVPRSKEDLLQRHDAFQIWSDRTFGVMSRLSEFTRSLITGWYANRHHQQANLVNGGKGYAEKMASYYEYSSRNDLLSTAACHDPQMDRSKLASELDDPDVNVHIVQETEEGIVVRGAKMIATAAPYVDEILVYPLNRKTAEDRRYALFFAVAVDAPGLHIVCRESFASEHKQDDPLSAQFDEMDAILIFDDVLIPWERVFIKEDPEALWAVRNDPVAGGLSQHQTIVRLVSKLEFVTAIGHELATAIGAQSYLHVQEKLAELVIQYETIKGLLVASEYQAAPNEDGIWLPKSQSLITARNLGTRYYPRALEILQQVGAGGFFQVPSKTSELNGPLGSLLQKYYRGSDRDAFERTKLFKLAWDLIGSKLGARHELYERFYTGDPVRTYAAQYLNYDKKPLIDEIWKIV